jgi:hypothetical protein
MLRVNFFKPRALQLHYSETANASTGDKQAAGKHAEKKKQI